jgi:drug/metabolite transporter (DMT)-like permease
LSADPTSRPPPALVLAAFAAIYLIWGSTYLGIRFAVESMPPFMMGGARFLLAGGALYGWLRWRGVPQPDPAHWRNATAVGALLLGVGNGGVNWAEQRLPSGLVALIIAVTPLWFALLDWLRPGGAPPKSMSMVGILVGFAGMVVLVGFEGGGPAAGLDTLSVAAVIAASIAWAAGSLYARYTPKPEPALMAGALQMLAGGTILTFVGLALGEADAFSLAKVSRRSALAFGYLTLIGSLVGFSAYMWLLKVSTPARVSTYAYVNPVIAVLLGWALAGEQLTARMLMAAAIIIAGVVIMTTTSNSPAPATDRARLRDSS